MSLSSPSRGESTALAADDVAGPVSAEVQGRGEGAGAADGEVTLGDDWMDADMMGVDWVTLGVVVVMAMTQGVLEAVVTTDMMVAVTLGVDGVGIVTPVVGVV